MSWATFWALFYKLMWSPCPGSNPKLSHLGSEFAVKLTVHTKGKKGKLKMVCFDKV
jgi:hypothetical protein